jgi:hypothetical protein
MKNILLYALIAMILVYILATRNTSNYTYKNFPVPVYVQKFKPVNNACTRAHGGTKYYNKNSCADLKQMKECGYDTVNNCIFYRNDTGVFCGTYDKEVKGKQPFNDYNTPIQCGGL